MSLLVHENHALQLQPMALISVIGQVGFKRAENIQEPLDGAF